MNEEIKLNAPEEFDFPFPPYDIQHEFMKHLYETIEAKKLGIFESPTGTGKSLSIICGALRWLKDHNSNERSNLSELIRNLEAEKRHLAEETVDWLSSQSKEIEVTRRLHLLKIDNDKLTEYDRKIEKLKARKKVKIEKAKFAVKKDILTDEKVDVVDDEEILLEEPSTNLDDDESDEDENEKFEPVKIFICSRTHSQLSQFVGEIIKSPFGRDVRVASLSSRQNYCINPSVKRLKNVSLINERCLDMQKNAKATKVDTCGKVTKRQKNTTCKCPYFKQQNIEELKDSALLEVQDVEDLVASGKQLNSCPYYASRKAAEDAEVVLVPYNTILHKATREANGIKLKNSVVIIDEAHNLLEAMAQMYGCEVNYDQLHHCLQQLKNYKSKYNTRFSAFNLLCINQIVFIVTKLKEMLENVKNQQEIFTIGDFVLTVEIDNYNMFKLIKFCKDTKIAQKLHSFSNKYPQNQALPPVKKGIKDFLSSIEIKETTPSVPENCEHDLRTTPPPSNPLLAVASFMEALTYSYEDGRIMAQKSPDKQRKFQFLSLNPAIHFKDIVRDARAVIVAGGTMKPTTEFKDRLFVSAGAECNRVVEFSCDHIVSAGNILPIILTKGPSQENLLFNYENRSKLGNSVKNVLIEACKKITGGIVVFFPSYKYENWFWQFIKDVKLGRSVFREPKESGTVDAVLDDYAKAIQKSASPGALLFSVVGGKLSEGLNFSDELGRCVIVIGMPYANIFAPDLKEKMSYLDRMEGSGAGQKFYDGLCMKSVNQCIGRAVRHKNDYASVLLLDERYNKSSIKNALPGWIKRSLKTCQFAECFKLIDEFFQRRK